MPSSDNVRLFQSNHFISPKSFTPSSLFRSLPSSFQRLSTQSLHVSSSKSTSSITSTYFLPMQILGEFLLMQVTNESSSSMQRSTSYTSAFSIQSHQTKCTTCRWPLIHLSQAFRVFTARSKTSIHSSWPGHQPSPRH